MFYTPDGLIDKDARKEAVKESFKKYFPPETWGEEVFVLQYEFGGHRVLLRRAPSRGKPSEGLILSLPPFCEDLFQKNEEYFEQAASRSARRTFNLAYEAWINTERELHQLIGDYLHSGQLFVPAGRAFFSNIENNVFSFIARSEKALDPFLSSFGEYFSYLKMRGARRNEKKNYPHHLQKDY